MDDPTRPRVRLRSRSNGGAWRRRTEQVAGTLTRRGHTLGQAAHGGVPLIRTVVRDQERIVRQFARWLVANTDVAVVADITRNHIEDHKVWLAAQPGTKRPTCRRTPNGSLRMIRIFLERLIE